MKLKTLPIADIQIRDRTRSDYRNIDSLAASIKARGLLQPVVVRTDGTGHVLVAGGRRLEALRRLEAADVPTVVVDSVADELEALYAEGEENTEREPFTPTEAVRHAERIEAAEKAQALERKAAAGRRAAPGRPAGAEAVSAAVSLFDETGEVERGGNFPPLSRVEAPVEPVVVGKTRDRVAKATGMSGRTLEKARHVVETARDPEAPAVVREAAQDAVETMDRTGKVDPAFRKVKEIARAVADAPVDDLLAQDAAVARARLQHRIQGAIKAAGELAMLPVSAVSAAMDEDLWIALTQTMEVVDQWVSELERASGRKNGQPFGPPNLTVIGGGR